MFGCLVCVEAIQKQTMPRRNFPSILLYSFGLALASSLVFNGFLLYQQYRQHRADEYEREVADNVMFRQQLLECTQDNRQKDSLIKKLEQFSKAPPPHTRAKALK